jgi:hypothetical protein
MRRIYGPTFAQGNWQIRNNSEINELIGHDNIIGFVKTLRLKWLGHVERMHSGRMPKMILKARMEGCSEGSQGPTWTVVLLVMMMMMSTWRSFSILIFYAARFISRTANVLWLEVFHF